MSYPGVPALRDVRPALTEFDAVSDGEVSSLLEAYRQLGWYLVTAILANVFLAHAQLDTVFQLTLLVVGLALPYAYVAYGYRVSDVQTREMLCYAVAGVVGAAAAHSAQQAPGQTCMLIIASLPVVMVWLTLHYVPYRNRLVLLSAVLGSSCAALAAAGHLTSQLDKASFLLTAMLAMLMGVGNLQLKIHLRRRGRSDPYNEGVLFFTTLFFCLFLINYSE